MREKILCLDIGAKIIGVAVSDAFGLVALPRDEIRWGGDMVLLRKGLEEIGEVHTVVVGRPPHASRSMEEALERVVDELQGRGLSVEYVDEHVSTQEAANRIADAEEETGAHYPSTRKDSVAAQIILERYLAQNHE